MIASVTIFEDGRPLQVPVLPLNAIVPSKTGQGYAVFVLDRQAAGPVARMRDVRLGEAVGNGIAVVAGVKPGELVITNGSNVVTDGEQVQIVP
jgi:membrane fusion protein (multidrug efflux system)